MHDRKKKLRTRPGGHPTPEPERRAPPRPVAGVESQRAEPVLGAPLRFRVVNRGGSRAVEALPMGPGEAPLPGFITAQPDGVTLAIKLQPRAAKNEIGEPHGPELRIRVTAPPVDAAANEALLRLLADTLECPRGKMELVRGHTARHKIVRVHEVTATQVLKKIGA